jgi:3-oxoacyl-[acyl-carrier protein] reductase
MKRLGTKIAIVTGSSSGIGKAIALRLAEEGCRIVVAARRIALCDKLVQKIQERGGDAVAIPTDVMDEVQVDRLIAETVKRFGRLDILINNAGIGGKGPIAEMSTQAFDQVLDTNLRGTFFCCRAGFRAMMKTGGGIIINMSSVCGVDAWAGTGSYSASKYGIMGLTKALADEGRPHKIKACAICPGGVADELVDASREELERSGLISPFDIADTVLYLVLLGPHATVHQIIVDRMGADW